MPFKKLILALTLIHSCCAMAEIVGSQFFSLQFPSGWHVEHEEKKGQLGAITGTKKQDGYTLPWLMMEYCVNKKQDHPIAPSCSVQCPSDPFADLRKDDVKPRTSVEVIGDQKNYYASMANRQHSALLMVSCSPKGIASINVLSDLSETEAHDKFFQIVQSFRWK